MPVFTRELGLSLSMGTLVGRLFVPELPAGVVVCGTDSLGPHYNPHAVRLARELTGWEVAILLLGLDTGAGGEDVLASEGVEDAVAVRRAARRLVEACTFLECVPEVAGLRRGLFGTGTAAAAALVAATQPPTGLVTVACCGGHPQQAREAVEAVQVPTLLVVGSEDERGLLEAMGVSRRLPGEKSVRLVPGASRSFQEAGAWEEVVHIVGEWLHDHLQPARPVGDFGWTDPLGRWI